MEILSETGAPPPFGAREGSCPMKQRFKIEDLLSLPNQLSILRLLLIPLFVYLYTGLQNHVAALLVVAFSALTDILDGVIARRCHMVTELGKILDPAADKLTQLALAVCLGLHYPRMWAVLALLVVKEITMAALGWLVLRRTGRVNSARWYGKLCTAVLYIGMGHLVLLPALPDAAVIRILCLCAAALLFSFGMYLRRYILWLREAKKER